MHTFSLAAYRDLLLNLKEAGYDFAFYEESEQRLAAKKPFVILRHDVDISLRAALEMAQVEHDLGLRAVYFVLFRSPFYNLLSRQNAEIMQQLHNYGHQLALHVDLAAYDEHCEKALLEIELLSKFFPFVNTGVATLHSPVQIENLPIELFQPLNAVYGLTLRKGEIAYISDSTGRWRYGHPLDSEAFFTRKPIQLLTHPIWWVQEGETATAKLEAWFYQDYLHTSELAKTFLPKLYKAQQR
ncbi:hypothetical protein [Dictyobacter kobayashii]|uniref:Polysaccharide deacetylase n=1 Tax=Dictyobacter kobayashii TaxID=2014872 RepID=A0A402APC9_9CHLR|nr:hypothetical protein [Dictyobacter kobayashii]GCE20952.1 hypothetical protein KDK_47520 [Dictyobacter kobayashii]